MTDPLCFRAAGGGGVGMGMRLWSNVKEARVMFSVLIRGAGDSELVLAESFRTRLTSDEEVGPAAAAAVGEPEVETRDVLGQVLVAFVDGGHAADNNSDGDLCKSGEE